MADESGKVKKRTVHGLKCETKDGRVWSFEVDGHAYNWCLMKQVRHVDPHGNQTIVAWVPSLAEAVAMVVGYHDGAGKGQRTSLHLAHL